MWSAHLQPRMPLHMPSHREQNAAGAEARSRITQKCRLSEHFLKLLDLNACICLLHRHDSYATLMEPIAEEPGNLVAPVPEADSATEGRAPDLLRFTVTGGPAAGQVIDRPPRLQTVLTVGRTKASRVHIKDPAVSEKHGEIRWNGAGWELRDLGSSNGTKLNGRALSADGDPVLLKDGDIILFGTDSTVSAEVMPHAAEDITVEQYFEAECHRLIQRVQGRYEQAINTLQAEFKAQKAVLLQEAG